jgi:catechol-2,3-dioxygenase
MDEVSVRRPTIAFLGHIGLRCYDVAMMAAFYRDILGFTQTDEDTSAGFVFLSADPAAEHHQLLLARGRTVDQSGGIIQQLSFRCAKIEDVIGFYERFLAAGVRLDMVVSHGNAVGIYFFDPEDNRCEVYWDTGLKAKQPFVEPLDLSIPADELLDLIHRRVGEYGDVGYQDPAWRAKARAAAERTNA